MTRRRAAAWAAVAAALAALLRVGTAVLTEFNPVFPDYYYNDAQLYDASARLLVDAWANGRQVSLSAGTEAYSLWVGLLYEHVAAAPIVPKLINALLGATTACLWGALTANLFGRLPGLIALALTALWPSHVFYTSQNFKEAPTLLLMAAAFWGLSPRLHRRPGANARLAAGALATTLLGFLRAHLLPFIGLAAAAGATALRALGGPRAARPAAAVLIASLAGTSLYPPIYLAARSSLPGTPDGGQFYVRPLQAGAQPGDDVWPNSPSNISEYRARRQSSSIEWGRKYGGHDVATTIFPEASFGSWLDIGLFLPKASFYALFMPLPGLYPSDGKLGRLAAMCENSLVLALFVLAAAGFWTARRRPQAWLLAAFFVLAVPPSALFEFDLGSASRHRLQTLCVLVPFAALQLALLLRRLRRT